MTDHEQELNDILRTLNPQQLAFVAARMSCTTDANAAKECHIPYRTAIGWDNKKDVNRAVWLSRVDVVQMARERLRGMIPMALDALQEELSTRRNPKRLEAIREVLDRAGVEGVQKHDIRVPGKPTPSVVEEVVDAADSSRSDAHSRTPDSAPVSSP